VKLENLTRTARRRDANPNSPRRPAVLVNSSADISACGRYRYSLTRTWNLDGPTVVFIGLNPSTADATADDPTIRRCSRFAREWHFGGLIVVNLFAFRATDPRILKQVDDSIGSGNDEVIRVHCESAERIVVAWGIHGSLARREEQVLRFLRRPYCLGVTKNGSPRHPLYLAARTRLHRYPPVVDRGLNESDAGPYHFSDNVETHRLAQDSPHRLRANRHRPGV
jgi:hypothetical protein